MRNVLDIPGDEIVDRDDAMAFREQAIGQVRAEKTGAAGDNGNARRPFLRHRALTKRPSKEYARTNCYFRRRTRIAPLSKPELRINSAQLEGSGTAIAYGAAPVAM